MAVTVNNIVYGPSAYVYENGGALTFKFDVVFDGTPPATFDYSVDLMKPDGTVWHSSGTLTASTTGATTSVTLTVTQASLPGAPPATGVRPRFSVASTGGNTNLMFCTGITPKIPWPPRKPHYPDGPGGPGKGPCDYEPGQTSGHPL